MRSATITEAKNRLSALIDLVRHGETVVITDRGRPVARLIGDVGGEGDDEGRLARLERAGVIRRARALPPTFDPLPDPIVPAGGVDLIIQERREGW